MRADGARARRRRPRVRTRSREVIDRGDRRARQARHPRQRRRRQLPVRAPRRCQPERLRHRHRHRSQRHLQRLPRAAFEPLQQAGDGVILNISATLHYHGTPLQVHALGREGRRRRAHANLAVEWGPVRHPRRSASRRARSTTPRAWTGCARRAPRRRSRDDPARPVRRRSTRSRDAAVFLRSRRASYVTGDDAGRRRRPVADRPGPRMKALRQLLRLAAATDREARLDRRHLADALPALPRAPPDHRGRASRSARRRWSTSCRASWFGRRGSETLAGHLAGPSDPRNLALACARCNQQKGRGPDAAGPGDDRARQVVVALLERRAARYLEDPR